MGFMNPKGIMKKQNYIVHVHLKVTNLKTNQVFDAGLIMGQYDTSRDYDTIESAKENAKLSLTRWLERFPKYGGWISYRKDDSRLTLQFYPKFHSVEVVGVDEPKPNSFEWFAI